MSGPGGVPVGVRVVLRLVLGRAATERALGDLEDVSARVAGERGRVAVWNRCVREMVALVFWAGVDGLRRVRERRWLRRSGPAMGRRRMRGMVQDVRSGWRSLARRPGFALMAAGVLGLGIGANVAILTLADALFLRAPSLVREPDRLVRLFRSWAPGMGGSISYPDYVEYRAQSRTVSGLAASASSAFSVTARVIETPVGTSLQLVTDNWFEVLGVGPAAGRFFGPEENRTPDTHAVAVVSWGFAQAQFGDAAAAIGRELRLNGHPFEVVGVIPRAYAGLQPGEAPPDVYIPIMMRNAVSPQRSTAWRERVPDLRFRWLTVIGRLAPGATVPATQAELSLIADRIRALEGGAGDAAETVLVTQDFRWTLSTHASLAAVTRTLLIAVSLLLVIAAANTAILMLARASTRDREVGIRSALGAGRLRLARQMLAEGAILGVCGGVLGVGLSMAAAPVAASLLPVPLARVPGPDAGTLVVALGLSLVTALVVALVPALRASRVDVSGLITGRDRHAGGGRVRDVLVMAQVALSLVLVAGAALFARSLAAARDVETGFEAEGVLLVGVNLTNHGYDAERGRVFVSAALERLAGLTGVRQATTTRMVPYRGDWTTVLAPGSVGSLHLERAVEVGLNVVSPGYFAALGIPLVRGRGFEAADDAGAEPVIVVNETFVREVLGNGEALGRLVPLDENEPELRIVGVARDADYYAFAESRRTQVYLPLMQSFASDIVFVVKTTSDPLALVRPVQSALHALDPDIALTLTETLETVHAQQLAGFRATAHVVGLSGLIALLLASAGLYGVMAFRVARRTREIGMRMALGQTRGSVAGGVLGRALRLTAGGAAVGLCATLAMGRLVRGLVFGVPATDAISLLTAPLVLLAVTVVAALVPARRAMTIDPMRAIRND